MNAPARPTAQFSAPGCAGQHKHAGKSFWASLRLVALSAVLGSAATHWLVKQGPSPVEVAILRALQETDRPLVEAQESPLRQLRQQAPGAPAVLAHMHETPASVANRLPLYPAGARWMVHAPNPVPHGLHGWLSAVRSQIPAAHRPASFLVVSDLAPGQPLSFVPPR